MLEDIEPISNVVKEILVLAFDEETDREDGHSLGTVRVGRGKALNKGP